MSITRRRLRRGLQAALGATGTVALLATGAMLPAQATSSAPPPVAIGRSVHLSHLDVTVTRTDRASESYFFGAKVEACATSLPAGASTVPFRWDSWRVTGGLAPGAFEEGQDPWAGRDVPVSSNLALGACVSGWVPFAVPGTAGIAKVRYSSGSDQASWTVTNGASPQRALGSTATFGSFTVRVTTARQDDAGFRAYATVCVRSLPKGSTGGRTRISWDPWLATAGTHFGYVPWVYDASHTVTPLFPQSRRYKKGQCARGWLPFEDVDTSVPIDRLRYRNSLGNQAFWTVPR